MDIPHSSKVVTGRRGPRWRRLLLDRSVTAPCPVCGTDQRWSPGDRPNTCFHCWAAIRVSGDGTIREVSLDDMRGYDVMADDIDRVSIVMPAICAVCGAEPSTTGKVKDDGTVPQGDDYRDDARAAQQAHRDLGALGVPLCAKHGDQTPVSVDGSLVVFLTFDSYRYYRAFLLVNGLPKKARASASQDPGQVVARPRVTPGQLEPLICPGCGAPLAVSDGDETTCVSCGHKAPLPEPYKQLRDAKRMSGQDAAQLHTLAAEVAAPPPVWKRTAMVVGYAVGGATLVVIAIGSIIGAVAGLVVGSKLGESAAKLFAIVGAVAVGVVSIPYVGEWLAALAMLHHTSVASDIATGPLPAYRYDLVAAAMLYGLGVIPIALALHTQGSLDRIVALQGKLAAQRSTFTGGGLCCRHCGAGLDLARDAIVSRCLYCGADNLLTVPADLATAHEHEAKDIDASVQDAVAQHARERSDDRAKMWALLGVGLLLAPYVCASGYLLHRVFFG